MTTGPLGDPDWEDLQRAKLERAKAALEADIAFWNIVEGPDPVDELEQFKDDMDGAEDRARAEIQAEYDRMLLRVADHLNQAPHELAPDRFPADRHWRIRRRFRIIGRTFEDWADMLDPNPPIDSEL